jgi:DNA-binding GntR family transcriptional regulator
MELPPGIPLVEAKIANTLGISRTPVREALRQLAAENLIEVYPQSGNFVAPIKVELVENAVFIRTALEMANMRTLAKAISAQELMELRHNIQKQELAIKEADYYRFHDLDEALHRKLFQFSGREMVWELILSAKAHLDRARIYTLPFVDMAQRALNEHNTLVEALGAGNPDQAAQYMKKHLDSLKNILKRCKKEIAEYLDRESVEV